MRGADLDTLRRLSASLSNALSSGDVARAILDDGLRELGAHSITLWMADDDGRRLTYAGGSGAIPPEIATVAAVPYDSDMPGAEVVRTGEAVTYGSIAERNEKWPSLRGISSESEASAALPLVARSAVIGVLAVGYPDVRDIDDDEMTFLLLVADQCALALDRATLLDAEREARETLEFLGTATRIMVSALDPQQVVDELLDQAVPRVADWCTVYVLEGDTLERAALRIDGSPELEGELLGTDPQPVDGDLPISVVFRTRRPQVIPHIGSDMVHGVYPTKGQEVGRRNPRSAVVVPIIARGDAIGVISFVSTRDDSPMTERDLVVATGLAGRFGIALDNARRYDRERNVAATLVAALLPEQMPIVPGWSFVAQYVPAGDDVCGDWYDLFELADGGLVLGVGDAVGHGLPAASLMAELRNAARGLAVAGHGPGPLLVDLSSLARQRGPGGFATATYLRIDARTGDGRWAAAGHPSPLVVSPGCAPRFLGGRTALLPPLGVVSSAIDEPLHVAPGDTVLLFSDGLVERRGESIDVGLERLVRIVAKPAATVHELADAVMDELARDLRDDCCLLVARREPSGSAGTGSGTRS